MPNTVLFRHRPIGGGGAGAPGGAGFTGEIVINYDTGGTPEAWTWDGTQWVLLNQATPGNWTAAAAAPAAPQIGDWWWDTVTDTLYIFADDGTATAWVDVLTATGAGNWLGSAAVAPAAPKDGDIWHNTVNDRLYIYLAAAMAFIEVRGL